MLELYVKVGAANYQVGSNFPNHGVVYVASNTKLIMLRQVTHGLHVRELHHSQAKAH